MLKSTMHHVKSVIYPQSASPQSMLGKLPKPKYQNMESKRPLINRNEEEDIELATKRSTAYDASSECKVSGIAFRGAGLALALYYSNENIHSIKQSTRPQRRPSLFHRKATLILTNIVAAERTININIATTDASITNTAMVTTSTITVIVFTTSTTTTSTMLTASTTTTTTTTTTMLTASTTTTTTTAMVTTSPTKTSMTTMSTTRITMLTTSATETAILTTSTAETTMIITLTSKTPVDTTSTAKTTMFTASATETTMLTTLTNSHITTMNVSKFNKWKQNGITVAGGNGEGQELNQLKHPTEIFIDKNKNMFIADYSNHRIVEWKYNATEGRIIAGGNEQGNRTDQSNEPTDVIVDQQNHSIIIADSENRRVIQWLNQTQQILIRNIDCWGLAIDKHGFLYVSDWKKNEVRRWKMGEYNNEGIVVAGGNGEGHQLNQLSAPDFIFVDEDQSVYVTDRYNQRVMRWRKDAKEGKIVAGGNGKGANLNQLFEPAGVTADDLGQIYVTDWGNHRIMRWYEGKEEGEIVVGGNGKGNQSNQLNSPCGLSFDDERNLYVADRGNHRIQKFEIIL
ncbi:unnamed protein product [Adineta steineri]|uniref:Uncharacterized protein n=1 Tax=Adineta steineri TaxID=433720 RepID=A0A814RNZ3_9BILA|nr:unnamed protein product [Adineta steineri]